MEINDLVGVGEVVKVVSSAVGRIYNDLISIPLNMRRVKLNNDIDFEITNEGYKIFQKNKETELNNVTFEMQQEILKTRNQLENLNNLMVKLEKRGVKKSIAEHFSIISESDKLYLLEKYKYEDDEIKMNTINDILAKKLTDENDFSRTIFDFVLSLTKKDILKLKKIRELVLEYKKINLCGDELVTFQYENEKGEILYTTEYYYSGYYFPYIGGDKELDALNTSIRWDDIQNYAMRGLYTSTNMKKYFNANQLNGKTFYILMYNNREFLLNSNQQNLEGDIFGISELGEEIFKALSDESESSNDDLYIKNLESENLLPAKTIEITGKSEKEIISILNNK